MAHTDIDNHPPTTADAGDGLAGWDDGHADPLPAPAGTAGPGKAKPPPSMAKSAVPGAQEPGGIINMQPVRAAELQPRYATSFDVADESRGPWGSLVHACGLCCGVCPGSLCGIGYRSIPQGAVGMVSRFGRVVRSVDPGLTQINPCSENVRVVNVQMRLTSLPEQKVLTKDNVRVTIESVVYWQISNPYRATYGINNVELALMERAQTTLRQVVGARTLQTVITEREAIAAEIEEILEPISEVWGVHTESVLLKDIILNAETQQLLSSAATQRRVGESKIIAARAEVQAARLMREASDVLASPAALQLRQLDALQAMAKTSNAKTIFVPMSLTPTGGASIPDETRAQIAAATSSNLGAGSQQQQQQQPSHYRPSSAASSSTAGTNGMNVSLGDVAALKTLAEEDE